MLKSAVITWMKVKYLDKRFRSFVKYSLLLLLMLGVMAALFWLVYHFFSIDLYNRIIFALIVFSITVMVMLAIAVICLFAAIKTGRVYPVMLFPVRVGLKLVMPFALFTADVLKRDKDLIRSLFIDINNLFVESGSIRKSPDRILLLLPHCLQNSECEHKITNDITKCSMCGRCTIGAIKKMAEERGVRALVVTGGTAARNAIAGERPEIVISVACERDLAIGISDVSRIPVIGVLNKRPYGPCVNTTVDVGLIRKKLDSVIAGPMRMEAAGPGADPE
jgi:hypothetical protein